MWKTEEPPLNTRVLVSAKGKVWIGRYRPRWPDFKECEWSFDGKTMSQTKEWVIDGWQPTPEAVNAKPQPQYWRPTTYLDALEISVRAENALRAAGLTNRDQIQALTKQELLNLPNVGELTADEIIECREKPNEEILARME